MSVATESTRPDERLLHPLEQLRGAIRHFVLLDGLLTAGLFVLAWFWLGLAIDFGLFKVTHFDWVLDAPHSLRIILLVTLTILLFSILITRLLFRLNTQFSYPALALVLEKRFPKILGDKLITAVELFNLKEQASYGYSPDMIRATVEEARARVKEVPIDTVFDWPRLYRKGWLVGLVALGIYFMVFLGNYAITGDNSVNHFNSRFGDIASIWAERNLMLMNTPWPRHAHLELLGITGDEIRVGKGAEPPRIRVRAYRWVLADRSELLGWRPLRYSDLRPALLGQEPPPLSSKILTNDKKPLPDDAATWDVDRLESVAGNATELKPLFQKLEEQAAKTRFSRTLRRLEIPGSVLLTYNGVNTRNDFTMTREPNNEFTVDVTGLTESVRFSVHADDFRTRPRSITLVPPPMFTRLTRIESQPAYLFHAPPIRENAEPNWSDLKNHKQLLSEADLSLTGERTVFSIVKGTEFDLKGITDKPLKQVNLKPKVGRVPGLAESAAVTADTLIKIPLTGNADRNGFTLSFRGANHPVGPTLDFEITLVDDDDVTTTRSILVQVTDDMPPSVELGIDVLRRQGNAFLATPIARIPFLTESKVKDDYGLGQLEFVLSYNQVEAQAVVGVQSQALAGIWSHLPLNRSLPSVFVPLAATTLTQSMTRPERRLTTRYPVPKFREAFNELRRDTPTLFARKLTEPTSPEQSRAVKEIRFGNQESDALDLAKAVPSLFVKEPGAIQPRYRMDLNLVATDTNVESGPRTGQNLEPIRLTIVSEADLLTEMSKDEESLSSKLDEVLKRLKEAQLKLTQTAERLVAKELPPDVLTNATVRAQDIAQDIAKARDISGTILNEYRRLYREAMFNVLREEILARYQRDIISPMDAILQAEFPASEEAHKQVQAALLEGKRPEEASIQSDKIALQALIVRMQSLREQLGEAISLNKIRDSLRKLIEDEESIGRVLKAINKRLIEDLYAPEIKPLPTLELNRGQKLVAKHPINWQAFTGSNFSLTIEGPKDGSLRFPQMLKIPDDKDAVEYEITAGDKPGEYTLKLVPSVGKGFEQKVRVK